MKDKERIKKYLKYILELVEDKKFPARRNITDYVELIIAEFDPSLRDEMHIMAREFYEKSDAKFNSQQLN